MVLKTRANTSGTATEKLVTVTAYLQGYNSFSVSKNILICIRSIPGGTDKAASEPGIGMPWPAEASPGRARQDLARGWGRRGVGEAEY